MGIVSVTSDDNKHLIASIYAMWIEKEFEISISVRSSFSLLVTLLIKKGIFESLQKIYLKLDWLRTLIGNSILVDNTTHI